MRNQTERRELIRAVLDDGESARAVATRLGIPMSTAQRWVRIARSKESASETPRFVEVVGRRPFSTMQIRIGIAELEVQTGFDARLLREVVAALGGDA